MSSLAARSDTEAEVMRLGAQLMAVATARKQDHANLKQLDEWMAQLRVGIEDARIHAGTTSASQSCPSQFAEASSEQQQQQQHGSIELSMGFSVSDVRKLVEQSLHSSGRNEAQELAAGLGQLLANVIFRRVESASELLLCLPPGDGSKKKQAQEEVGNASTPVEEGLYRALAALEAAEGEIQRGGDAHREAFEAAVEVVRGVHDMAEIRAKALTRVLSEE